MFQERRVSKRWRKAWAACCLAGLFSLSCKPPKDAATGSCSGESETLSVMPESETRAELEKASSISKGASDILENLSGIGGYLTYVGSKPANPSELMAQVGSEGAGLSGPFKPNLPVCTVQLFGIPEVRHRYLLWTSRNCIKWSEVASTGGLYVSIFGGTQPLRFNVPRQEALPQAILAGFDQVAAKDAESGERRFGPMPRAELSNVERFVVSLEHYYQMPDTQLKRGEKILLNMLEKKANQIFEWRQSRLRDWKSTNPARLKLIEDWMRLTETFALRQTTRSLREGGLICETGTSTSVCARTRAVLLEEHKLALSQAGIGIEAQVSIERVFADRASWTTTTVSAVEREQVFAQVFTALEAQAKGSAPGAIGVSQAAFPEGLAGPSYEQAFLHGFHREKGVSESAYMPMPLVDLFRQKETNNESAGGLYVGRLGNSQGFASLVPIVSARNSTNEGPTAIVFDSAIQMEAFDEGQMVSLFGILPVSFVSLPGARYGKAPLRYRQSNKVSAREGSLHRARCK